MKEKLMKLDRPLIGVIIGTILPILGFMISYPIKGGPVSFVEYIDMTINQSQNQQDILIFCMLPNMFLFYLTNFRWNMNNFTKGLVAVTILLGLMLVMLTVL